MISGIRQIAIFSSRKNLSSLYSISNRFCCDQQTTTSTTANNDNHQLEEVLKQLKDENVKLTEIYKETEDKYKRALAEMENVRQRMSRQIEEARQFGIHKFCKDLLDVADTLTSATRAVTQDELEANAPLRHMHRGLALTETHMLQVLARHGVERIQPAVGDKFDPNYHEALFQMPLPSDAGAAAGGAALTAGCVAACSKVGYKIHHKTLRPAAVGVFQ